MKNLAFISFFIVFTFLSVSAQDTNDLVYCNLMVSHQAPANKFFVQVDYGEAYSYLKQADERAIKDENGKKIEFNSPIHALNHMIEKGWKFVQFNIVSNEKTGIVQYHYLLSKKKE